MIEDADVALAAETLARFKSRNAGQVCTAPSRFYVHADVYDATGMKFTSAYANPNCAPTRASLLTGRYTPRHGVMTVGSPERGSAEFRKLTPPKNTTELSPELTARIHQNLEAWRKATNAPMPEPRNP